MILWCFTLLHKYYFMTSKCWVPLIYLSIIYNLKRHRKIFLLNLIIAFFCYYSNPLTSTGWSWCCHWHNSQMKLRFWHKINYATQCCWRVRMFTLIKMFCLCQQELWRSINYTTLNSHKPDIIYMFITKKTVY